MTKPTLNTDLVIAVNQLFPRLTRAEQQISVALYRLLAEGRPVAREALAARAGLPRALVDSVLGNWYGIFYDTAGEIIGYWGLTLQKMAHCLRINGQTLYAWCAWDTLFLPQILGTVTEVKSNCPVSGETIRLTVGAGGIQAVDPLSTMVSFVTPEQAKVKENVVLNFCHYVHFFRSLETAESWRSKHAGTRLLTVEEAWALGRVKNAFQYGEMWGSTSAADSAQDVKQQSCCAG